MRYLNADELKRQKYSALNDESLYVWDIAEFICLVAIDAPKYVVESYDVQIGKL